MAAVTPLVWDSELESVRNRLDGLKGRSDDNGVWSQVYSNRNNLSTEAGAGAEQTLTGLTVGADARSRRENSMTTRGVFFSWSHSDVGFDRGGKGNVDSYSAGAYAGWEHCNGAYVDGVVKVNRFAHTVRGRMSGGGAADGHYDSTGAGGHVETGIRLWKGPWSVTPYAAFTGFTTDSQTYGLSNGMRAEVDTTRLLRGEAGAKAGWRLSVNGVEPELWVKAAVRQEYADANRVKVNEDGDFVNEVSGTSGVYQAGVKASLSEDVSGHVMVSYGEGAGVESPWNVRAGFSWRF